MAADGWGGALMMQKELPLIDEASLEAVLVRIRAERETFQKNRRVTADIIQELQRIGLYRGLVPEHLGGTGMSVGSFLRIIERIAGVDGSTGWVASFAFATKYLSSLPKATLEIAYADNPDLVFAGTVFPPQPARRVEGGFMVSGRWPFGSGCTSASLIGVGISIAGETGGLPRLAIMQASKVTIEETWNTIGILGSGSHDIVVDEVFVPEEWTLIRGGPPSISTPAYRYPNIAMAAQVLAVCGLGVAGEAIRYLRDEAAPLRSITGAPCLADRANVQATLGRATAMLEAARSWFYQTTDEVWATVEQGGEASREQRLTLRLVASHAARTGADVARMCFEVAGTMGIFVGNPLGRCLTDAAVVAQHAFLTEGTWMSGGKALLGQDPGPGFI